MIVIAETGPEQSRADLLDNVSGGDNGFLEDILNSGTALLKDAGDVKAGSVYGVTGAVGDTLGDLGKIITGG